MEKRKDPRFPVEWPLSFSHSPISFRGIQINGSGKADNISAGGCKVESDTTVDTGTFLEMRIQILDEGSPVEIDLAVVRWSRNEAFGLEFINMRPEEQERLQQYVKALERVRGPNGPSWTNVMRRLSCSPFPTGSIKIKAVLHHKYVSGYVDR